VSAPIGNGKDAATTGDVVPTATTTSTTPPPAKCFTDDESGMPKCAWRGMSNGETVTITATPASGAAITLDLTAVVPAVYTAIEECKSKPVGFLLKKAGTDEGDQPNIGVYWSLIGTDGSWSGAGNGGVSGMLVGLDPAPATDSGVPRLPTYALSNHCDDLYKTGQVALVSLMTVIHDISVGGIKYEADFVAQHAADKTKPSGYYVAVAR